MNGKVFDELTCPDCGGHLPGASAAAPDGRACTCFAPAKPTTRRALPDEPDPLDLKPLTTADGAARADGKKLCRVCGKDLAGRSRLKDEKGYICKKCSDDEFKADDERDRDAIECPECHRKLKAAAFEEWRGTLICRRCKSDHIEHDKVKVAQLGELTLHKKQDKHGVIVLSIVAVAILVIGLIWKLVMS